MSDNCTSVKTTSRVTGIFLKAINFDTRSMEVVTEFTEKETKNNVPRIIKSWTTTDVYDFRKVTREELYKLRLSKAPGVLCKDGENLFYTPVPGNLRLNSAATDFGSHACGKNCSMVCKGCPRTNDLTVAFQERCGKPFSSAVKQSWRLEKYPFIVSGIEAFNMDVSNDACIVFLCKNYNIRERKMRPSQSAINAKLGIAHYFWDDFDGTREQMKARIQGNVAKNRDFQWIQD